MGKFSVSLDVVEQPLIQALFLPKNLIWVSCIETTSATLLLEILYVQLQAPGSEHDREDRFSIRYLDTALSNPARQLRDSPQCV